MTPAELRALPVTVDVPTAGRAYGIGARHSYELARRGEFPVPVRHLGRLLRVKSADLVADLDPRGSERIDETPGAPAATSLRLVDGGEA